MGDLLSNLASFLNLLLVVLDYRMNGRGEFIRAFKEGNLDDKEILQQFSTLLLHEITCSFSRSTCKRGTCTCKREWSESVMTPGKWAKNAHPWL